MLPEVDEILTPSYHGEKCRHNGDNPEYEIACDNCDFFYACFPEADELFDNPELYEDKNIYQIKTSPDEVLQAFLKADAAKEHITDEEIEIDIEVMEELANRREARGEARDVHAAWEEFKKHYLADMKWSIEEE